MTTETARSSFAELYERILVEPLFRPFAAQLLDDAALTGRDRLLDVACGTGIVARLAAERGCAGVVGVDSNPGMLAIARRLVPGLDWREGDAGAPPLHGDERFDLVVCQQGLQFFPDKPAALRAMRGALAREGRVAVGTWRSDDEFPVLRALRDVAERRLGPIVDKRHALGDAAAVERLLHDAGFGAVRSRIVRRRVGIADAAPFLRLNALALIGMSALPKETREDERERLLEAIVRDSAGLLHLGTGLSFEIAANEAIAVVA